LGTRIARRSFLFAVPWLLDRREAEALAAVRSQALLGNEKNNQLAAAKTPQGQTVIQRQIDATDRQIDRLVYELYGLTDAEIKIVEAASP